MWSITDEKRLSEIGLKKEEIDRLSDKTRIGVGLITEIILGALNENLITIKKQ